MSTSVFLDASLRQVPRNEWYRLDRVDAVVGRLGSALGWAESRSPFERAVPAGATVVVKPNWVMHANKGPWGLEPLVTHQSLVQQVCEALLRTGLGRLTLGDAPLQSCDFASLLEATGARTWAAELSRRDPRFVGIRDFRRTRSVLEDGLLRQAEEQVELSEFVLFDLGADSLLDPVAGRDHRFRVTQYRPDLMRQTHGPGFHQYLVARSVIEADVVVNLPKLKMHRKAGITNALKNLIGINGNKEFLPHHRLGGAAAGGDCYPGRSGLKRGLEILLDLENSTRTHVLRRALRVPARALSAASRLLVDDLGVEGAWSGNDTIWRTCLDLNRILLYGQLDGKMATTPQRRVLHIMDAIVAGQGEGPLAPMPFDVGVIGASEDPAALDWIGSRVLGYRPDRVPLVREAFACFRWPLTESDPTVVAALAPSGEHLDLGRLPHPIHYPQGWLDAVSFENRLAPPIPARLPVDRREVQPADA